MKLLLSLFLLMSVSLNAQDRTTFPTNNAIVVAGSTAGGLAVGGDLYNHVLAAFGFQGNPLRDQHQVAVYSALKYASNGAGADTFLAGFETGLATEAANYTVSNIFNYAVGSITKGAGSTIRQTVNYGLYDQTAGDNNAQFAALGAPFIGSWFIRYEGSRPSYLGGTLEANALIATSGGLNVTGEVYTTGSMMVGPEISQRNATSYLRVAGGTAGSGGSVLMWGQSSATTPNSLDIIGPSGVRITGDTQFRSSEVSRELSSSFLRLSGGTAGLGATVIVYGNTHGTTPNRLQIDASGGTKITGDTYLIGGVGIGTLAPSSSLDVTGQVRAASIHVTNFVNINSNALLVANADGVLVLYDSVQGDFKRVQFGGTGAAAPGVSKTNGHLKITSAGGNLTTATNALWFQGVNNFTQGTNAFANQQSGKVKMEVGHAYYYVTNSLVTTNSILLATLNSSPDSERLVAAVPLDGVIRLELSAPWTVGGGGNISWFIVAP